MMKFLVPLFVPLFLFVVCILFCSSEYTTTEVTEFEDGVQTPGDLIVHGQPVDSVPAFMASLLGEAGDGSLSLLCGASVVDKRWVLTAQHCVFSYLEQPEVLRVRVGSKYTNKNGKVYKVEKAVVVSNDEVDPKDPNPTFRDDVAIVRVDEDIDSNRTVKLGGSTTGEAVRLYGWGYTQPDANISDVLRYIDSEVLPDKECEKKIHGKENLFDAKRHICIMNTQGGGACKGDSGGPAVTKDNVQVGITKGAPYSDVECGEYPAIYTDVAVYKDLIEEKIQENA